MGQEENKKLSGFPFYQAEREMERYSEQDVKEILSTEVMKNVPVVEKGIIGQALFGTFQGNKINYYDMFAEAIYQMPELQLKYLGNEQDRQKLQIRNWLIDEKNQKDYAYYATWEDRDINRWKRNTLEEAVKRMWEVLDKNMDRLGEKLEECGFSRNEVDDAKALLQEKYEKEVDFADYQTKQKAMKIVDWLLDEKNVPLKERYAGYEEEVKEIMTETQETNEDRLGEAKEQLWYMVDENLGRYKQALADCGFNKKEIAGEVKVMKEVYELDEDERDDI